MNQRTKKISNPLTLIAIFSGASESIAIGVLPFLAEGSYPLPVQLVWFVVLYPVLIVVLFFITLWTKHYVFYAPGDYPDPSDFIKVLHSSYGRAEDDGSKLMKFWKPDGKTVDKDHAKQIKDWMLNNGLGNVSITTFLRGKIFVEARKSLAESLKE